MLYSIENKCLKIIVESFGAQLQSIQAKASEREYLWQGDSAYWAGRAYNLFPTIGRMYKNTYTYQGKEYKLRPHGVARYNAFKCVDRTATKLVFLLTETEETLQEYINEMPDDCIYPKPNGWRVQVGTCTYGKNYLDQIEQTLKKKYTYLFNMGV